VARAPYGTITTVQSEDYTKEVGDIKKIFFAQQALPRPVSVPASSAITLQLPADIEKEVLAKDGINKLKLFHICGMIDPDSTAFGALAYPTFSSGMDIVLSQPRVNGTPLLRKKGVWPSFMRGRKLALHEFWLTQFLSVQEEGTYEELSHHEGIYNTYALLFSM